VIVPTAADNGWGIPDEFYSSTNGSSWQISNRFAFQLGIYATPVPEPKAYAMFGLGLAALTFWRRKTIF
jgi:hypothetical protein